MMRRCPYCGNPSFPILEKMGMRLVFPSQHRSVLVSECSSCKNYSIRTMGRLGRVGHLLIATVFPVALLLISVFLIRKLTVPGDSLSILLYLISLVTSMILWVSLNYFFCHFDKRTILEREADARLQVAVPEGTTLWPYVKKGEIYKARLPKRGNNEADSVIIVMVADRRKGALTLRVIQAYGLPLPAVDEPLWLITHGDRVVEGTVTAMKPGHDVTPPPYYSGRE